MFGTQILAGDRAARPRGRDDAAARRRARRRAGARRARVRPARSLRRAGSTRRHDRRASACTATSTSARPCAPSRAGRSSTSKASPPRVSPSESRPTRLWRDVAGMLRSLDYAAGATLREFGAADAAPLPCRGVGAAQPRGVPDRILVDRRTPERERPRACFAPTRPTRRSTRRSTRPATARPGWRSR